MLKKVLHGDLNAKIGAVVDHDNQQRRHEYLAGAIDRYYVISRTAMERGKLPQKVSYLPYLQYTLAAAHEGSRT